MNEPIQLTPIPGCEIESQSGNTNCPAIPTNEEALKYTADGETWVDATGAANNPISLKDLKSHTILTVEHLMAMLSSGKVVKWDPSAIDAQRIYEIQIRNGQFEIVEKAGSGQMFIDEDQLCFGDFTHDLGLRQVTGCDGSKTYKLTAKRVASTIPTCNPTPPDDSSLSSKSGSSPSSASSPFIIGDGAICVYDAGSGLVNGTYLQESCPASWYPLVGFPYRFQSTHTPGLYCFYDPAYNRWVIATSPSATPYYLGDVPVQRPWQSSWSTNPGKGVDPTCIVLQGQCPSSLLSFSGSSASPSQPSGSLSGSVSQPSLSVSQPSLSASPSSVSGSASAASPGP